MELNAKSKPKQLRETLCLAQSALGGMLADASMHDHIERLQELIEECDRHRPLDFLGKHGDLHTETCGCEDNAQ